MRNRIEEKIAKFIQETEVGMVVAPELNVDSDRKKWLQSQGFDDVEGLPESAGRGVDRTGKLCNTCKKGHYKETSIHDDMDGVLHCDKCGAQVVRFGKDTNKEGREMQASGVFEQVGEVFNINTAKSVADHLKGTILAPVVGVQVSDLGGAKNVSILILVSLDKKEDWPNHILENSRYSRWHFYNDGTLEQFTRSKIDMKFRKTRVKTVDEAMGKINTYLKQVKTVKETAATQAMVSNRLRKQKSGKTK